MKKLFALLLALVMTLSLAACGGDSGSEVSDDGAKVIKIGIYEPSSGANGAGGKKEVLGIEYANSVTPTVTIGGEEYQVEVVPVDNQSENDKGVSAAQQLVSAGVAVVLGSYGSGVSMAAAPVFEEASIPAIGCSCTNPGVTLGNPYYFRVCYLDPFQGSVLANLAKDEFDAKVAYVFTELGDDYSEGLGEYFSQECGRLGIQVVADKNPAGNTDMSGFVNAAKNAGADVIFAPTSTTVASLLIDQAASAGIPLIAGDTWDDAVILQAASKSGADVYFSTFYDEGASQAAADFMSGFQSWLNANSDKLSNNGGTDTVSAVSALGYDAYMVAIEAIKAADSTDSATIKDALASVTYTGVTGDVKFDEEGDVDKNIIFIKGVDTDKGEFYSVKEQGLNG
ncbi:ABC transporter substrate-binding protein [uncultured Dysosmobacter sp.]|uniref:ABC transporter substrate-binding protein n=1 Tax=uncultured Dysosmobacter sp. TaxID=2591384 RepID=UPI0026224EB5|nr:ABC transporter substrate-binding protein [uncultured Dysosmobacter sp.]